jgi:predicted lipoprotein with Yx(FWY)xxD motif
VEKQVMIKKEECMNTRSRITMLATAFAAILAFGSLASAAETIQVRQKEGIGKYLADGKGMTLYYFVKNKGDLNACSGPCLEKWPVFYTDNVTAPAGTEAKDFGVITRSDGKKQVTYKGWPLYYFAMDKKPGDTKGQGVKDVWFAVTLQKLQPYF